MAKEIWVATCEPKEGHSPYVGFESQAEAEEWAAKQEREGGRRVLSVGMFTARE
jgi:hypothetical protein